MYYVSKIKMRHVTYVSHLNKPCVYVCVCVYVSVFVRERKRQSERGRTITTENVCVCVCGHVLLAGLSVRNVWVPYILTSITQYVSAIHAYLHTSNTWWLVYNRWREEPRRPGGVGWSCHCLLWKAGSFKPFKHTHLLNHWYTNITFTWSVETTHVRLGSACGKAVRVRVSQSVNVFT